MTLFFSFSFLNPNYITVYVLFSCLGLSVYLIIFVCASARFMRQAWGGGGGGGNVL